MISPSQGAYHFQVIPGLSKRLSAYQEQYLLHVVSQVTCGTVDITTGRHVQLSSTVDSNNPKFKEGSPFSEIDNSSNGQETPRRLWKTKYEYDGHEFPPVERLLHMHPVLGVSVTYTGPLATFDKTLVSLRYGAVSPTHKSQVTAHLLVG